MARKVLPVMWNARSVYMFKLKKRLIKIISVHTGKPEDQVKLDSDRDYYMTAAEAKDYGLVDEVVKSRKELKPESRPETLEDKPEQ